MPCFCAVFKHIFQQLCRFLRNFSNGLLKGGNLGIVKRRHIYSVKADFRNTFRIEDFIGRTICVGGTDIVLRPENIDRYRGQIVDLYSPMTCACKYDLCYKCCGQRLRDLGVKKLGLQTVKITSQFMQTAMKAMHGTVLQTKEPRLSDVLL